MKKCLNQDYRIKRVKQIIIITFRKFALRKQYIPVILHSEKIRFQQVLRWSYITFIKRCNDFYAKEYLRYFLCYFLTNRTCLLMQ